LSGEDNFSSEEGLMVKRCTCKLKAFVN
jgi:hypothetical protein